MLRLANGVDAFGWSSDLIVDNSSPIPKPIQRVMNFVDRCRALHPSPDKHHQLGPDGPARHDPDNVTRTTFIDNMAKFGALRLSRDVVDLLLYIRAGDEDYDVSRPAAFLNNLADLNAASVFRKAVPQQRYQAYFQKHNDVLAFLDGRLPDYEWQTPLPMPNIVRQLASYPTPKPELVAQLAGTLLESSTRERLREIEANVRLWRPDAPAPIYNKDGACTLYFPGTTSTRLLARYVCAVFERVVLQCDRVWSINAKEAEAPALSPLKVYMHLFESLVEQAYVRIWSEDGTPELLGTADPLSGIPIDHSGTPGSPSKATYVAHEHHGLWISAFADDDGGDKYGNHCQESWAVNLTRGSWRFPTIAAHLRSRQRPLQVLANKLAAVGVIEPIRLRPFVPSAKMTALWTHNKVETVEAVARSSRLVDQVQAAFDAVQAATTADAARRSAAQSEVDQEAGHRAARLPSQLCTKCRTRVTSAGLCAACQQGTRRLQTYQRQLDKLHAASSTLQTLPALSPSSPIKRASRDKAIARLPPSGPDIVNAGYGIGLQPPPAVTFFAYTCSRYGREREKGWTGDAAQPVCKTCADAERRSSSAYMESHTCYECGTGSSSSWRKGNLPGSMLCSTCSDDKSPGLCIYPECPEVLDRWRWWPERPETGKVCGRHTMSLLRNEDDKSRLTGALDVVLEKAPKDCGPLDLKLRLAQHVSKYNIETAASSAKRSYTKAQPDPEVDSRLVRSAYPFDPACLYPLCPQEGVKGFPGLTQVGQLCQRHISTLARKARAQEKMELSRCLVRVCQRPSDCSLKEALAAAVKEEGIQLSATGPPQRPRATTATTSKA